jgi:hypothetical protein
VNSRPFQCSGKIVFSNETAKLTINVSKLFMELAERWFEFDCFYTDSWQGYLDIWPFFKICSKLKFFSTELNLAQQIAWGLYIKAFTPVIYSAVL